MSRREGKASRGQQLMSTTPKGEPKKLDEAVDLIERAIGDFTKPEDRVRVRRQLERIAAQALQEYRPRGTGPEPEPQTARDELVDIAEAAEELAKRLRESSLALGAMHRVV